MLPDRLGLRSWSLALKVERCLVFSRLCLTSCHRALKIDFEINKIINK
jgi:hypothetical protein